MTFRLTQSLTLLLGLLGLSTLTGPAQADARQDVLSATQRCGGIADDRNWLDCYYGAAQPMRAQLGLPSAPAGQIRLVPPSMPAAPTYMPQPAPSAQATGPAYVQTAPETTATAGPPPLKRARSGGFFSSLFGSGKPLVANIRMRSFARDKTGRFNVTLADGEIWQLDETDDNNQPHWRGAASRYVVNIYEGALRSYNMEVSDDSHLYKVHRIN